MSQILLLPPPEWMQFCFKMKKEGASFIRIVRILIKIGVNSQVSFAVNKSNTLVWGKYDPYSDRGQAKWYQSWTLARWSLLAGIGTYWFHYSWFSLIHKVQDRIVMVLSSTVFQTQRTMLMTATNKFTWPSEFVIIHIHELQIMVGVNLEERTQVSALNRIPICAGSSRRRYGVVSEKWPG